MNEGEQNTKIETSDVQRIQVSTSGRLVPFLKPSPFYTGDSEWLIWDDGPDHKDCYHANPSVCKSRGKIRSVLLIDPLQMHRAMFSTPSTNGQAQEPIMQD